MMTLSRALRRMAAQEDLNFLLTNRIPRIAATRLMGRLSHWRQPLAARLMIRVWQLFTDLDLSEAQKTRFDSLHDCFIRALKPGARPIDADPDVLTSPCDGIVGAQGRIVDGQLFQAKGMGYRLEELLGDAAQDPRWRNGQFVTIRITSAMYHRFHAPADGRLTRVTYFSGDTWNVNPIALKRVERLFCRNERAFLDVTLDEGTRIAVVPVAAVLVASIRLHAVDTTFHLRYAGANPIACEHRFAKGDELGWFEHGSTVILLTPPGFELASGLAEGDRLRMGQALLRRRSTSVDPSGLAGR